MKPTGVPGKQESGQKHNPFSTLAAAAAQSAKAAKKRPSPSDDDDLDYKNYQKRARRDPNLEQYQKGAGKTPQKPLKAKPFKKKSGSKGKPAFTRAIKKGIKKGIVQVQWHSDKSEGTRRALSCCAGNCVWPDWSGKSHKTSKQTSFPGDSIVGHPRGHGSLVSQAHVGYEPMCYSCQMCDHPA